MEQQQQISDTKAALLAAFDDIDDEGQIDALLAVQALVRLFPRRARFSPRLILAMPSCDVSSDAQDTDLLPVLATAKKI